MSNQSPRRHVVLLSVCLLMSALSLMSGCGSRSRSSSNDDDADNLMPPEPAREFRAAWVATVANIDWPTKPGLSTAEQKREIIAILDKAKQLKMNAIVLQVRTSCDALYASELEPWSEYLTGRQGRPPEPFYDPLKMWIDEAHKRGIELHAWFNPYRARATAADGPNAPSHISNTNPAVVKSFNGYQWLDPGEEAAQELTYNVFLDVVKRYDVDGIHIDDYFYPYPDYLTDKETKVVSDFPDEPSWQRYVKSGGTRSRDDWRRHNVDHLIERIYKGIKREKPHVHFGISPFGIAQPGKPGTVKSGFNQFEKLYADAQLWWNKGWCDYYTPQLYWQVDSDQPYADLLRWWSNENLMGRHLWPGLFTSKLNESASGWRTHDLVEQIHVTRHTPGATGHVHFSMKALMRDSGAEAASAPPAAASSASRERDRSRGRRGRRGGPETQPTTRPMTNPVTNPTTVASTNPTTGPTTTAVTVTVTTATAATTTTAPTTSPTTGPTTRPRLGIATSLQRYAYAEHALVPASRWLDDRPPAAPKFSVGRWSRSDPSVRVTWEPRGKEPARVWAVHAKHGRAWKLHVLPPGARSVTLMHDPVLGLVTAVSVSAVDRMGNLSPPARAKVVGER